MLIFTQLLRNYRELFGENAKNRRHLGAGFLLNDRKLLFVSIREQKKDIVQSGTRYPHSKTSEPVKEIILHR